MFKCLCFLLLASVLYIGVMEEGNDFVQYEITGENLTITAHAELNGSMIDRENLTSKYGEVWTYTNGDITGISG